MKVLIIGLSSNVGGVENFIKNYITHMEDSNFHFDFLVTVKKCAYEEEIIKNHKIHHILISHKKHPIKIKKHVINILKDEKYDAIWLNDCSLNQFFFIKYAKKANVPIRIVHSHNSKMMANGLKRIIQYLIHLFYRVQVNNNATDYWACSMEAAKFFYTNRVISSNKFKIINNAIQTDKFKYNYKIREKVRNDLELNEKKVIIQVGRFHKQKNHSFSIKFIKEILKFDKDVILLLVGTGELKENIINEVKKSKMEKNVKILEFRDDINELLQGADIFILPSLYEGLPFVLIEAQAAGLPCLISNRVSKECDFNKDFNKFLDINNMQEWLNTYKEIKDYKLDRNIAVKNIIKNNFDLDIEAKKIKEYLCKQGERK